MIARMLAGAAIVHESEPLISTIGLDIAMLASLILCVFLIKKENAKKLIS
jgi:hypothetical protein